MFASETKMLKGNMKIDDHGVAMETQKNKSGDPEKCCTKSGNEGHSSSMGGEDNVTGGNAQWGDNMTRGECCIIRWLDSMTVVEGGVTAVEGGMIAVEGGMTAVEDGMTTGECILLEGEDLKREERDRESAQENEVCGDHEKGVLNNIPELSLLTQSDPEDAENDWEETYTEDEELYDSDGAIDIASDSPVKPKDDRAGQRDSVSSTDSTSTDTVTSEPSPQDELRKFIPNIVPKYAFFSAIKPKTILSPLSVDDYTFGSTIPREYFSSDLKEDGALSSKNFHPDVHNVRLGMRGALEKFVLTEVYRAETNTGVLLYEPDGKLKPKEEDDQSYYREGKEYTVLSQDETSKTICLCQDNQTKVKFIRKERPRVKFQGQKKSVLVPLKHQDSSYIMDIYGVIVMEHTVYILMEYCEGGPITYKGKRSIHETCEYIQQILKCLSYLHKHELIHGDIKPENICLRSENDLTSMCLIDFDFVRIPEEVPQFKGYTTQYLPPWWPELSTSRALLMSMDLWATACIAICFLTGKRPWSEKARELKKIKCSKCSTKTCLCDQLHIKLRQYIQEQGSELLNDHIKIADLKTECQGEALWQTLLFLTQKSTATENGAEEAISILTGETRQPRKTTEIKMIPVEIVTKQHIIFQTAVKSGTQVFQVLERTDVVDALQKKFSDRVLASPERDHIITSPCKIKITRKQNPVTNFARKLSKKFRSKPDDGGI